MGKERMVRMNGGAERLAEATWGSWEAVTDAVARQQEQAARFALGWTLCSGFRLQERDGFLEGICPPGGARGRSALTGRGL